MSRRLSSWTVGLGLITLVGLAIRLGFVIIARRHAVAAGDSFYYHYGANLLAQGKGFINPFPYWIHNRHQVVQAADFPPLYTMVLALASVVGFKSFFAHAVWSAIIGTATVVVVGLLTRQVAGQRAGLIAAGIAAVYPNLWMNDGLVHAESLSVLMVAIVLYLAYRLWSAPSIARALWLGVALGLAVLTRDELALLVLLLVLPLILLLKSQDLRRRLKMLGVAVLATVVVLAPWCSYNLVRFQRPELVSTGLGVTLATANCDETYHGFNTGYWWLKCADNIPRHGDESVQDATDRQVALHYVRTHLGRVPYVVFARLGRAFGFYRPVQQINLDVFFENRPKTAAFIGLGMYYALAVASLFGVVVLRRRRVPVLPFVAVFVDVVIAVIVAFGQTRYRATLEVVLVALAAVALDAILPRRDRATIKGTRQLDTLTRMREVAELATAPAPGVDAPGPRPTPPEDPGATRPWPAVPTPRGPEG